MDLPYNLRILPGVKQWHNGKLFRLAAYPSGKCVPVPYEETGAAPARMIPSGTRETVRKDKQLPTTGFGSEPRRKVLHVPKRLHIVEARRITKVHIFTQPSEELLAALQPLVRLNGGKVAEILQPSCFDYHNQYHIDEEVK